jgi:GNAT superfamily N-acetyltransferase
MSNLTIRSLKSTDREKWWELWQGYIKFYKASVSDDVSEVTWQRLLDDEQPAFCRLAEHSDYGVIAMMNYVLHLNLWTSKPVCYLEDLYTDPAVRGEGAGRALIESLRKTGEKEGWHRIYWMTAKDNDIARTLYDKVASETHWVRYDINL